MDPNNGQIPFRPMSSCSSGSQNLSGGFEFQTKLDYIKGKFVPLDINLTNEKQVCEILSKLAVSSKNERLLGSGTEFVFVQVESADARRFFDGRIMLKLNYIATRLPKKDECRCQSTVLYGNGVGSDQLIGFTTKLPPLPSPPPSPYHEMTEDQDQYKMYKFEVENTDGFNVTSTYPNFLPGQIIPLDLTENHVKDECENHTRLAVLKFNELYKDSHGELEFVSLVRAMSQVVAGWLFYITFKAMQQGDEQICQTIMLRAPSGRDFVLCFRINRANTKQEWLWDHRHVDQDELEFY